MAMNVDEYLKSLEPPSFTYKGQTYTGRRLTFNEGLALSKEAENIKDMTHEQLVVFGQKMFTQCGLDATIVPTLLDELMLDGFVVLLADFFTAALGKKRVS